MSIQAKNINKSFNKNDVKIDALLDFTVDIPQGSVFGLLGPNGAGKSTFINILAGLVKKDSGKILVEGIDHDKELKLCKRKIGIVPQELNIDPFFTPYQLLELQAGLYGVQKKDRITKEILKRVGLKDQKKSYARTLSGGMRRRLLIAKALVHNPNIIILDEPTAGVDVELRQNLWSYIRELNQMGKTICLTTHYLEEAEKLCDQILIMNKGKIIVNEKKDKILKMISLKKVTFILDKKNYILPEKIKAFNPTFNKNSLKLEYDKNNYQLKDIIEILRLNDIEFSEINTEEGNLEDIFINLTN